MAFALAATVAAPAVAQTQDEIDQARQRRDEVRAEAAEVAGRVDVLTAEADALVEELDRLERRLSKLDSRLTAADQAVDSTERDLALAQAEVAVLEGQRAELESTLLETLVDHYIDGQAAEQGSVLTSDNPTGWALRKGLVGLMTNDVTTTRDQLRAVGALLEEARAAADALHRSAQAERDEAAQLASAAQVAHEEQERILGEVSARLDRRLAEAEALAVLDVRLAEEIRRGEEEIARRLAVATAKANLDEADVGDGSSAADRIARPDDIVNVRGIEIHRSVADQLLALINAAEAAGIILGGAGWRSTEHQIELRMRNCGTTDYLIFDAPSEACWPPTARPASSNHEAGFAVDFTANGRAVVDTNSAEFLWLAANAPSYGFYNLWSEPWHWSTDGR